MKSIVASILFLFISICLSAQEGQWGVSIKAVQEFELENQIQWSYHDGIYDNFEKEYKNKAGELIGDNRLTVTSNETLTTVHSIRDYIYEEEGQLEEMTYKFNGDSLVETNFVRGFVNFEYKKLGIDAESSIKEDIKLPQKLKIPYDFDGKVLKYTSSKGKTTIHTKVKFYTSNYFEAEVAFENYIRKRINPNL